VCVLGIYILKRFGYSIVTLFIIITLTFFLMRSIPGSIYTKDKPLPPKIVENIKAKYGLDLPLSQQYFKMLGNVIRLDFGMSMQSEGRKVNDIIAEQFPNSAKLGIFAIFLCLIIGIPLGIISALKNGKWQDNGAMILATLGVTIPSFVVATLGQYIFSVKLKILPVMGFKTFASAIMPAIALSFFPLAFIARLVRSSMLETLEQDFIRTARAKGLSEQMVIFKHALKNSLIPVVTYLGPLIAAILTGSFVVERIFNIPGLGRYYVTSISNRDYTVMMGITIFYAGFVILMNFLVDIVYVFIDPRIKLRK
jgi:oligopeptide transport system permease protein